jgi:hypothetical protein
MAFAERFAPDRHAIAWLAPRVRGAFAHLNRDLRIEPVLGKDTTIVTRDVAARAVELASCAPGAAEGDCVKVTRAGACDFADAALAAETYARQNNPYDRRALFAGGKTCFLEIDRDAQSAVLWALLAAPGRAILVPLHGTPAGSRTPPLAELPAVRRAVSLALSTVRVEVRP